MDRPTVCDSTQKYFAAWAAAQGLKGLEVLPAYAIPSDFAKENPTEKRISIIIRVVDEGINLPEFKDSDFLRNYYEHQRKKGFCIIVCLCIGDATKIIFDFRDYFGEQIKRDPSFGFLNEF